MQENNIRPFVKWAGGKRQLLPQIKKRMPKQYNKYFEPFIGGGAVLFDILPEKAVINDINKVLINAYRDIRDFTDDFIVEVKKIDKDMWEDGKEYYYAKRNKFNEKISNGQYDLELSTIFVFLNKHCFNGLYRVNSKGLFNVPYNNSRMSSIDENEIKKIASYLQRVEIKKGDFEDALKEANKGDFIFLDSPYAPLNPTSFEAYTKEGFDLESHRRLAKVYEELTKKGCYCMLTNHNTELIRELYGNKGYSIDVVNVKRMINSDAKNRKGEEVIICNY
ncbi:MAG: DNA adenine methylase [Lachnospiraceae bacterium]|jgi:DNA adenine methylase|nr:DNA adenine methylase [Lachnospiraceae bacterium]